MSTWLKNISYGFCMGTADLVPGVSGGTIALILGIYEKLISSVKNPIIGWKLLLPLLIGIAIAFLSLSHLIHFMLGNPFYRPLLFSAFFGLILGSVWFCAKEVETWNKMVGSAAFCGIVAAFLVSGGGVLSPMGSETYEVPFVYRGNLEAVNYNSERQVINGVTLSQIEGMVSKGELSPDNSVNGRDGTSVFVKELFELRGNLWLLPPIFASGMVAICAMLLPGISGSYVLVVLGVYPLFIGAVAELSASLAKGTLDASAFTFLANLGLGALLGALLFSHVISWFLTHYHNLTMATLLGLMVGALRAVWPFWSYQYLLIPMKLSRGPQLEAIAPVFPEAISFEVFLACLSGVLGFILIFLLEKWASTKSAMKEVLK